MSDLSRAIARARRQIEAGEAPIRRAMREAYRLAIQRIEAELMIVAREIATEPLPLSWFDERGRFTQQGMRLFRQDRLRRLLPLVEAEMVQFSDQGVRLLREGQLRAVSGGAADAIEFMGAAGVTARPAFGVRVNVPAVERLVSAFQPGPVRDVLDRYGTRAAEVIERLILQGVITGEGPRQVVKRIMGELDNGVTRARLDSLTRTEYLRAYRGSLFDQYGAMGVQRWVWTASHGSRTCLACLSRSGTVYPMTTPFMAAHVNCFIAGTVVNGPEVVGSSARWYDGDVVEISFSSGDHLTVTPNHPILTPHGWVAAGLLHEGGDVVRCDRAEGEAAAINPDYNYGPAFIEDVAESPFAAGSVASMRVPTASEDFHGDGAGSEVSVIRANGFLGNTLNTTINEPSLQDQLVPRRMRLSLLSGVGALTSFLERVLTTTGGVMGGSGQSFAFGGAGLCHTCVHGIGSVADGHLGFFQVTTDNKPLSAVTLGKRLLGFSGNIPSRNLIDGQLHFDRFANVDVGLFEDVADRGIPTSIVPGEWPKGLPSEVSVDHIASVNRRAFSGHVYNLQTKEGWYIANNIITHNCRCIPSPHAENVTIETGPQWFARQSPEMQRAMMPSGESYAAFQRGDVALKDFVGHRRSKIWGPSIRQLSGREAIRRASL